MIRLGLRLALSGGREAALRLAVITVAVAIGAGLLLCTLAGFNAVNAQNARYAWLETGEEGAGGSGPPGAADPLWWRLRGEMFHGDLLGRVDVAATGPHSPVPPGLSRLPGPGELYASPAMARLLRTVPPDQLADRYPGRLAGVIGPQALPSRDSLIVVVGRRPVDLAGRTGARRVTAISTTVPSSCTGECVLAGINPNGIDLVLAVVVAALLFPVVVFIGIATRLSAARREQRFAALRLAGATARQVGTLATVESMVAAVTGTALGFGLFFLARPALAGIPFTGSPFVVGDLALSPLDVIAVAFGVPLAAAVVARLALRRVNLSPLGVSRRTTPRPPRAWRLVPLGAGLGILALFVPLGRPASTDGQIAAYVPALLVTMAGLVTAGPWLTMTGARLVTRRASRPATLIAGRRLADNPQAGFRAVSGVVLALFVATVAIALITTVDAYDSGGHDSRGARTTLLAQLTDYSTDPPSAPATIPAGLPATLRALPGVVGTAVIHTNPASTPNPTPFAGRVLPVPAGVVACADLDRMAALGRCRPGAATAAIWPEPVGRRRGGDVSGVLATAPLPASALATLPVRTVAVATDGKPAALERARTVLATAFPGADLIATIAETDARNHYQNAQFRQLANVVIVSSLALAGCALAVSVVAGLVDRRRPFSLLRITGASLNTLRRVVALETAVPLLILAAVATGTGFVASWLFLRSQMDESLQAPGAGYYVAVAAGLAVSLAVIASTLPLLSRTTGRESVRFE